MRVAVFVNAAYFDKSQLDAIPGHVQFAGMAVRMLTDVGYDVTLITTKPLSPGFLPEVIPQNIPVHIVKHPFQAWPEHGVLISCVLQQSWQLWNFLRRESFDVLHFFGYPKTGLLLSVLKYAGVRGRALFTPHKRPANNHNGFKGKIQEKLFKRIDSVVATTDYVGSGWSFACGTEAVTTLRPGITKRITLSKSDNPADSILFWRQASVGNGADLAISAFRQLAPKYPNNQFVFAVREHDVFEREIFELERSLPNVCVYTHPYRDDVSLESLLQRALFVVLPFRVLSVNPQMSVLETLYAGVPVITTNIESNGEVIHDGQNGLLIPPNDERALTCAIERLLKDEELLRRLRRNSYSQTIERWNWSAFDKGLLRIYANTNIG